MVVPETVGLSTERLSRIDKVMEKHISEQKIAGGLLYCSQGTERLRISVLTV